MNVSLKIDSGDHTSAKYSGSPFYVDDIEKKHPGYLHFLYRYVVKTYGAKSGFVLLALVMNEKSDAPGGLG